MRKTILFCAVILLCGGLFAQPHIQEIQVPVNANFVQQSVADHGDNYVVAGTVVPGPISGGSDILVLLVDGAGTIIWGRYVDYGADEFVGAVIVDDQDHIVLT